MRRALLLLLMLPAMAFARQLPERGVVLPGINEEVMKTRLAESDLQALEGIWEYQAEQMTLAIERTDATRGMAYRLILLSSDDVELLPGTIVGYVESSIDSHKYHLWLYTERSKTQPCKPMECVATLSTDGQSLSFNEPHYTVKVRVNVVRLFTSIFRGVSVIPHKEEERLPVGFRKVFPATNDAHVNDEIRYL